MAQRNSGYDRQPRDLYETPEWVTESVVPRLFSETKVLWEPACGAGKMVNVLQNRGFTVYGSDVVGDDLQPLLNPTDFLQQTELIDPDVDTIITNPPYNIADEFIRHALKLMEPKRGKVAMLLSSDFDAAKTRRDIFSDHPAFSETVKLTRRIVWFEPGPDEISPKTGKRKKAQPSGNHCWFLWDWMQAGFTKPITTYAFSDLPKKPRVPRKKKELALAA